MNVNITTNYEQWIKAFISAAEKINEHSKKVFHAATKEMFDNVVNTTPVGNPSLWKYPAPSNYHPGTLKASWTLKSEDSGDVISNSQPYAERVEYGWSTQAPHGMLRIAFKNFPIILEKKAREYKI